MAVAGAARRATYERLLNLRRIRRLRGFATLGLVVLGPFLAFATFLVLGPMEQTPSCACAPSRPPGRPRLRPCPRHHRPRRHRPDDRRPPGPLCRVAAPPPPDRRFRDRGPDPDRHRCRLRGPHRERGPRRLVLGTGPQRRRRIHRRRRSLPGGPAARSRNRHGLARPLPRIRPRHGFLHHRQRTPPDPRPGTATRPARPARGLRH